jgi:hypothetical protein
LVETTVKLLVVLKDLRVVGQLAAQTVDWMVLDLGLMMVECLALS